MSDSGVGEHDPLDDGWVLDGDPEPRGASPRSTRTRPLCRIQFEHEALDDGWAIAEAVDAANDARPTRVDPALKAARIAALDRAVRARRRDVTDTARRAMAHAARLAPATNDDRPHRPTDRGLSAQPPRAPASPAPSTPVARSDVSPPWECRAQRPTLKIVPAGRARPPAPVRASASRPAGKARRRPSPPRVAAVPPARRRAPARTPAPAPAPAQAAPAPLEQAPEQAPDLSPLRRPRATSPSIEIAHALERATTQPWSRKPRRTPVALWFAIGGLLGAAIGVSIVRLTSFEVRSAAAREVTAEVLAPAADAAPDHRVTRVSIAPEDDPLDLLPLTAENLEPVRGATHSLVPTFADHYAAARSALARDDYDRALAAIDRALAIRATSGSALDFKARLLLDLDELKWALEVATEAVHAAPERAASWLTKGLILLEIGEADHARFALEYVIDLAPRSRHATRAQQKLDEM